MEFKKYVPKIDTIVAVRMLVGGLLTYQGSVSAYEVYRASQSLKTINNTISQDVDKVTKAYQDQMPVLLPVPTTEQISQLAALQVQMEHDREAVRRNRTELFRPNYELERTRRGDALWQTPLLPIGLLTLLYRLKRKPEESEKLMPQTYTAKLLNKLNRKKAPFKELQPGSGNIPEAFKQAFDADHKDK